MDGLLVREFYLKGYLIKIFNVTTNDGIVASLSTKSFYLAIDLDPKRDNDTYISDSFPNVYAATENAQEYIKATQKKRTMIDIKKLTIKHIGCWVRYDDEFGKIEDGRIKSWDKYTIYVVYKCNNEWDNFQKYTGQGTGPAFLRFLESEEI